MLGLPVPHMCRRAEFVQWPKLSPGERLLECLGFPAPHMWCVCGASSLAYIESWWKAIRMFGVPCSTPVVCVVPPYWLRLSWGENL